MRFLMLPLVVLAFVSSAGQAQQPSWSGTARLEAEVAYDGNPFLLKASRKRQLAQGTAADALSGRFQDMESATDVVPRPALELGLEGPGLGGRTLDLTAGLAYEANLQNSRRRNAELGVTLGQAFRRDARLRFDVDWRPSYFHKNYLRDAVDVSGDGNITPEERRYEAGLSREVDVSAAYRHRLVKATRERPVELLAELELGYFDRAYDAPFEGWSRSGPGAGVDLTLGLGRRWSLGLDVTYQWLAAGVTPEVLILDENAFGVDFNGNGGASDAFARAAVDVDRSRTEREVAFTLEHELSRAAVLDMAVGHRRRTFGSQQPYDVVNRDRVDGRIEVSTGLDVRLASGFHVMVAARHAVQTTNRAGDPGSTGDEADYTRSVVSAGVRYRL